MAQTSTERVRLHRLREIGYALKECPENVTNQECVAWAEGFWKGGRVNAGAEAMMFQAGPPPPRETRKPKK